MVKVRRIAHVTLDTPDIERQLAYYTDVLGLTVTDRTAEAAYLASTIDRQSIVLRRGEAAAAPRIAFQLDPSADLDDVARRLNAQGVTAERRSDPEPSIRAAITVTDPKGTALDLFAASDRGEQTYAGQGIVPLKLGHVAFNVTDIQATVNFYVDVLGFKVSDWMGDFFAFLRCNPDHHTVNFVTGKRVKMHHVAFELRDWCHMQTASDLLARHGYPIIWGPGRHAIGHNIYTYHRDPDNHIVELYCELDKVNDEALGYYEPRPWHGDRPQMGKVWTPGPLVANLWGPSPPADFLD